MVFTAGGPLPAFSFLFMIRQLLYDDTAGTQGYRSAMLIAQHERIQHTEHSNAAG